MKAYALKICTALLCCSAMYAVAGSRQDDSPQGQAYRSAYGLVLEGKWNEADDALAKFLEDHSGSKWTDDAHFWRCYITSRKAVDKEKAFSCFESFVQNFPRSSYTKDAQAEMVTLARDLVKQGKPEYEAKVRDLRESQEKETTLMVLSALRDIGDAQAWDALLDYFRKSDDERIRKSIVSMLDDFKDVDASGELLRIFKEDSSQNVRSQVVKTLSSFKNDKRVLAFYKDLIMDNQESMSLRKSALSRLSHFEGENLAPFFEKIALEGPHDLARSAVSRIGDSKDNANWEVLRRIYQKSNDIDVKRRVLGTMGDELGVRSLDFLTEVASKGESRDLRRSAIRALSEVAHPSVLGRLKNIINSAPDSDTRKYGVRAIGELRGAEAQLTLASFLQSHTDPTTRKAAAYGLADVAKLEAIPHLKKAALEDSSTDVKRAAIRALREMESTQAALALIEILDIQKNKH